MCKKLFKFSISFIKQRNLANQTAFDDRKATAWAYYGAQAGGSMQYRQYNNRRNKYVFTQLSSPPHMYIEGQWFLNSNNHAKKFLGNCLG